MFIAFSVFKTLGPHCKVIAVEYSLYGIYNQYILSPQLFKQAVEIIVVRDCLVFGYLVTKGTFSPQNSLHSLKYLLKKFNQKNSMCSPS